MYWPVVGAGQQQRAVDAETSDAASWAQHVARGERVRQRHPHAHQLALASALQHINKLIIHRKQGSAPGCMAECKLRTLGHYIFTRMCPYRSLQISVCGTGRIYIFACVCAQCWVVVCSCRLADMRNDPRLQLRARRADYGGTKAHVMHFTLARVRCF